MTFSVNFLWGQKQLASLFDVHLGTRWSQVLIHCGTVSGQEDVGAALGLDTAEVPLGPGEGFDAAGTGMVCLTEVVSWGAGLVSWGGVVSSAGVVSLGGAVSLGGVVSSVGGVDSWAGLVSLGGVVSWAGLVSAGMVGTALHFGQIVEVEVRMTVERLLVVTTVEDPPVVIVLVTGQVVTVV